MLSDTHCHLDFPEFDLDRDQVVSRAKESGIKYIINIGSSIKASRASVKMADCYDIVWAAVGIHPHDADKFDQNILSEIESLLKLDKVVAIGEIGLDYYRNLSSRKNQQNMFISLLSIAQKAQLPVVIHNRQASDDVYNIIKATLKKPIRGVIHCFSADHNFLNKFLDLGFYVSFTCNITYKKSDNLRNLAKFVPLDRLLLETDAPFLPPQEYRGKRNEPAYVKYLAQDLSRIKGIDLEVLTQATYENGKNLFAI